MPPGFPTAHSPTPRTRSTRGLRLRPETAAPPAPLPYGAAGGAAHLAAASSAAAPAAICCSRSEGAALLPIAAACSVATGPGRSQSGKIPRRHQRRLPPAPRPGRRPHADRRDLGGERAPWKPGHGGGRFSLCFSGSGRGTSPPRFTRAAGGSPPPGSLRPLIPLPPLPRLIPSPGTVRQPPGSGSSDVRFPPSPSTFLVVPPPPNRARRTPQLTSQSGGASRKTSRRDSARRDSARRNRQRSLTWRGAAAPWERRAEPAGGTAGAGAGAVGLGSSHRPPALLPPPGRAALPAAAAPSCPALRLQAAGGRREQRGRQGGKEETPLALPQARREMFPRSADAGGMPLPSRPGCSGLSSQVPGQVCGGFPGCPSSRPDALTAPLQILNKGCCVSNVNERIKN